MGGPARFSVYTALLGLVSTTFAQSPAPKCALVQCKSIDAEQCLEQHLAYIPSDGVTQCCDECRKVEDFLDTAGCNTYKCAMVFCRSQTFDECFHNQILVPSDGLCICCDSCVYKNGSMKCGPKNCVIDSCHYATPEECISKNLAFVPSDGDCICCDSCHEVNEVTEPIGCAPEICTTVKCVPQTIKDCNARQVLVPAGGCHCCDTCVDKKP